MATIYLDHLLNEVIEVSADKRELNQEGCIVYSERRFLPSLKVHDI